MQAANAIMLMFVATALGKIVVRGNLRMMVLLLSARIFRVLPRIRSIAM